MTAPDPAALRDLLGPAFDHLGIELVDVQCRGSGGRGLLRLVVDRPGGVTLDDCERASMTASAVLDAYDPIDVAYSLEVASPGAERPIRRADEWRAAMGRKSTCASAAARRPSIVEGRLSLAGGTRLEIEARIAGGRAPPGERSRRQRGRCSDRGRHLMAGRSRTPSFRPGSGHPARGGPRPGRRRRGQRGRDHESRRQGDRHHLPPPGGRRPRAPRPGSRLPLRRP